MSDRVGQKLGNYELIRLLGKGGFAEVYLGEHIHLGTQAAIKVLHTQLTSDDVDTFRSEARTIAHLIHPHIVRVLEFGIEDTIPFLVMDYAPNGTLRKLHPKGAVLPLPTIVSYVKQVAEALQYAHDEKVIHRDIKPENILLGRHNDVLLSDFGIALVAQSSRYQGTQEMAGTMAYMAPEQIQGKPRPASDQYALGVVVYEWLTGDRPFHGSLTEIVGQHLTVPPPPLHEKISTIFPAIEQVVLRSLAKSPKERFESVQAFVIALEEAYQAASSRSTVSPEMTLPSLPLSFVQMDAAASASKLITPADVVTQLPRPIQSDRGASSHVPAITPLSTGDYLLSDRSQLPRRHVSRRTMVLGLVGLAGMGTISLAWLKLFAQPTPTLSVIGSSTVLPGETLHVQGTGFVPNGSVTLKLENGEILSPNSGVGQTQRSTARVEQIANALQMLAGGQLSQLVASNTTIRVNGAGTFDAIIMVREDWEFGSHTIHATEDLGALNAEVHFTITPTPAKLVVNSSTLDFGSIQQGKKVILAVMLGNTGGQRLTWTADTEGTVWLIPQPHMGVIERGSLQQPLYVAADTSHLQAGNYTATLRISSNGGEMLLAAKLMVIPKQQ